MNLLQVRTQFVKVSGRYDLVVDTSEYVDNGANYFINAGLRWLQGKVDNSKKFARFVKDIAYGECLVNITHSRAVNEVWVSDADGRTKLDRKTLTWMRTEYGEDIFSLDTAITSGTLESGSRYLIASFVTGDDFTNVGAASNASGVYFTATGTTPTDWSHGSSLRKLTFNIDVGTPLYYSPCIIRLSPQVSSSIPPASFDFDEIKFGNSDSYNGVLLLPPPDATFALTVLGSFRLAEMSVDSDTNFWTEVYPDVLIQAAMFKIEQHYRNFEGSRDMEAALLDSLMGIEADTVEEEAADADTMETPLFYVDGNREEEY